jgi:hypothetical protein
MNHLRSFLTGARFYASDSLKPSWVALYDIDDTSTFQKESYTRLRANRSPREAALIARLETLDRRTCELVHDSGESKLTSSLAAPDPTKFITTHGLVLSEDQDVAAREEEIVRSLRDLKGWVRTRVFKVLDNLKSGTSVGKGPEEQIVPKFHVMHGM